MRARLESITPVKTVPRRFLLLRRMLLCMLSIKRCQVLSGGWTLGVDHSESLSGLKATVLVTVELPSMTKWHKIDVKKLSWEQQCASCHP